MNKNLRFFALFFIVLSSFQTINCYGASKNNKAESQKVSSSEGVVYVFPVNTEKQPYKPVSRVLTGIFTEKQQEKSISQAKEEANKKDAFQKKELPPRVLNEKTIAWTTPMNIYYHDPMNNCLKTDERQWQEEKKEIVGLEPCPDCFKKREMIPSFIKKECGNLEIAEAKDLLINTKFVEWAKERLPIKDMNFISSTKLLVLPNLDMTSKGLHQLALEVEKAYLRQTWRVIEVQAKSDSDSLQYVSSFASSSDLFGEVKENEESQEQRMTNINKVTKDLRKSLNGVVRPTTNNSSKANKNKNATSKKGKR